MSHRGTLVKCTGELYADELGTVVELLECGHGCRPSLVPRQRARCLVCADAPDFMQRALGARADAAQAVLEGRRLMAIEELTELEIRIPDSLLEQRHSTALRRVTTATQTAPSARAQVVEVGTDGTPGA